MTTALLVVIFLAILGVGALVWTRLGAPQGGVDAEKEQLRGERDQLMTDAATLKATLERRSEEVGELKRTLESERTEKNELAGKGKQLHATFTKLEAKYEALEQERDALKKQQTRFEAEAGRREKEADDKLGKLEAAKLSLDQERDRVVAAEREMQARLEEQRDRIWADHEKSVIARMTDLCKLPQYAFTSFSNTDLPDGFDGSLKPDFMIEFLDQYVIFDAKKSKSESLQTYIANTVKTTVTKVKKNPKIASMIFLVVPSEAISELKVHHHVHDGYTLYIISPEALAPILASLKRITAYEFAEGMDPQQRENIVQLVAELDFHINLRNAADLLLTKMGVSLLARAQKTDPQFAEDVALKKAPMNANARTALSSSEFKRVVSSLVAQVQETEHLEAPQVSVKKKDLETAKTLISDTLL